MPGLGSDAARTRLRKTSGGRASRSCFLERRFRPAIGIRIIRHYKRSGLHGGVGSVGIAIGPNAAWGRINDSKY